MVRRAALRLTSTSLVWALLHHTGAQYSAGAYTSARVDVLNVGVLAPQLVPARRRINADRANLLNLDLTLSYSPCQNQHAPQEILFFIQNQHAYIAHKRSNTAIKVRVKKIFSENL